MQRFGDSEVPRRPIWQAMKRGFTLRCPACGEARLFERFLKVNDACPACGTELHHHRADDMPPYLTIIIVGHIVVPTMLTLELLYQPDMALQLIVWPLIALVMSLSLLQPLKGGVVGFQWANRMHGFGDYPDPDDPPHPSQSVPGS